MTRRDDYDSVPPPPPRRPAPRPQAARRRAEIPPSAPAGVSHAAVWALAVAIGVAGLAIAGAIVATRSRATPPPAVQVAANDQKPADGRKDSPDVGTKPTDDSKKLKEEKRPVATDEPEPDFVNPNPTPLDPKLIPWKVETKYEFAPNGDTFTQSKTTASAQILADMKAIMTGNINFAGRAEDRSPTFESMRDALELDSLSSTFRYPFGKIDENGLEMQYLEEGFARLEKGKWVHYIGDAKPGTVYELIESKAANDERVVTVRGLITRGPGQCESIMKLRLPKDARQVELLREPYRLSFACPLVLKLDKVHAKDGFPTEPTMSLAAKPHLLAALAGMYGSGARRGFWAARAEFRNGLETLTDYRVRFRIDGYAKWTDWEVCEKVVPQQTVIHPYFPKLDVRAMQQLTAAVTPAVVEIEYEYTLPNERVVRESTKQSIKLLGIHEGVYTDRPLNQDTPWFTLFKYSYYTLASFATGDDPVIRDLAARLKRNLGDIDPAASDANATKYLQAAYDVLRLNIKYEKGDGSIVDGLLAQKLKYPRETLRSHAGTCVNTAILYAALAEAGGLEGAIVVVPGHAFAGAKLPKVGKYQFVETTGCGGGTAETSMDAAWAGETALKEFEDAQRKKLMILINLADQRKDGVKPTQLPAPPADALNEWDVKVPSGPVAATKAAGRKTPTSTLEFVSKKSVKKDGLNGLEVRFRARVSNAKGQVVACLAGLIDDKGQPVRSAVPKYGFGPDELLTLVALVFPDKDEYEGEVALFVPADAVPGGAGKRTLLLVAQLFDEKDRPTVKDPPVVEITMNRK